MSSYKFKLISFVVLIVLLSIVSGIPSSANAQSDSQIFAMNSNAGGIPTNNTQPTTQSPQVVSTLPVVQQGNSVVFTIGSNIVSVTPT